MIHVDGLLSPSPFTPVRASESRPRQRGARVERRVDIVAGITGFIVTIGSKTSSSQGLSAEDKDREGGQERCNSEESRLGFAEQLPRRARCDCDGPRYQGEVPNDESIAV